jgi:hypothetical protein
MTDELTIDSEQYISSKRASELSGYEQDYIGQLCRGGNIKARRVGGLWYVSSDSLMKYKKRAEEYKAEPPVVQGLVAKPDTLISFEGIGYISTSRAAKLTGYSPDYVGQMARAQIIPSRQVGNRWYVEQEGLLKHKKSKDALLGAVQVESVGLKAPIVPKAGNIYPSTANDELFSYTRENGDLIPTMTTKEEELPVENAEEEYAIPIHVRRDSLESKWRYEPSLQTAPQRTVLLEPRRSTLPMLLPVGVFTIVVVLSLGFLSLKKSSIYTSNVTNGSSNASQTASAVVAFADKVADTLEPWITKELVYTRKE